MEEKIFLSIQSKLRDDNLPVTYSWIQQKFDISPKESQIFMKKYVSQNENVVATYLSHSKSEQSNDVLTTSDCHSENSVIISLKLNKDDIIDIKSFILKSDHLKKLPIICSGAYMVKEKANNDVPQSISKIENKTEKPFSDNLTNKSLAKNSKVNTINFQKKSPGKLRTENILNAFQQLASNSKPKLLTTKTETKEKSPTGPNKSITTDVNDNDSDFELPSDDSHEIPTRVLAPIKDQNDTNVEKSPIDVKLSQNSKLFQNFEDSSGSDCPTSSTRKRRRRLVTDSDDDFVVDEVLVDSSFHERDIKPKQAKISKVDKPTRKEKRKEEIAVTFKEEKSIGNDTKKNKVIKKKEIEESTKQNKSAPKKLKKEQEDSSGTINWSTLVETGSACVNKKTSMTSKGLEYEPMKKVEKTFMDEDGFLVVEKVRVPVSNDRNNLVALKSNNSMLAASEPTRTKHDKIVHRKPKKDAASGKQTNIMSFFQKNN